MARRCVDSGGKWAPPGQGFWASGSPTQPPESKTHWPGRAGVSRRRGSSHQAYPIGEKTWGLSAGREVAQLREVAGPLARIWQGRLALIHDAGDTPQHLEEPFRGLLGLGEQFLDT